MKILENKTEFFSMLAILEGMSYLLIIFVTMPLKYYFGMLIPNKIIGLLHGILFIAYIYFAFIVAREKKWQMSQLLIVLAASVIPFATFWVDFKFLKEKKQN
jgi:integral membrane protein